MGPLLPLVGSRFVSLTTFRRSGAPVSAPVRIGRDGESLVVLAPAGSGKVDRLPPGDDPAGVPAGVPARPWIERLVERLRGRPRTQRVALLIT